MITVFKKLNTLDKIYYIYYSRHREESVMITRIMFVVGMLLMIDESIFSVKPDQIQLINYVGMMVAAIGIDYFFFAPFNKGR